MTSLTRDLRRDEYWMQQALSAANRAILLGEVPVGAVIVCGDGLVATGFNQTLTHRNPTEHAEMMAIRLASQHFNNHRLPNCELFVTLEPCAMCAGAILHARLSRVVFGAFDRKTGVAGGVCSLFESRLLNHQTHVRGGVLAQDCAHQLTQFFLQRRQARATH